MVRIMVGRRASGSARLVDALNIPHNGSLPVMVRIMVGRRASGSARLVDTLNNFGNTLKNEVLLVTVSESLLTSCCLSTVSVQTACTRTTSISQRCDLMAA